MEDIEFGAHPLLKRGSLLLTIFVFLPLLTALSAGGAPSRIILVPGLLLVLLTYSLYKYRFTIIDEGLASMGIFRKQVFPFSDYTEFGQEKINYMGYPTISIWIASKDDKITHLPIDYLGLDDKTRIVQILSKMMTIQGELHVFSKKNIPATLKICDKCGKTSNLNVKYCTKCGNEF